MGPGGYTTEYVDDAIKEARERERRDEGKKGDTNERRREGTVETTREEYHKRKDRKRVIMQINDIGMITSIEMCGTLTKRSTNDICI